MSLSIQDWLETHNIELAQLGNADTQIAGIAFRIVQDMAMKSLTPFSIGVLADVLALPLETVWQHIDPISRLAIGLLRSLSQKKPLKRNEGTWLAYQIAYLRSLQRLLEQEAKLHRPWLDRASVPVGWLPGKPLTDPHLQALLKTLRPETLTDTQAEQALSQGKDSLLVQQMNNLAMAWFVANGAETTEAKLLAQRLGYGLPGDLLATVAENALPLAQLQKFVQLEGVSQRDWAFIQEDGSGVDPANNLIETNLTPAPTTLPFDLQQQFYRASLLQNRSQPLSGEPFALNDLYVPPQGIPITAQDEVSTDFATRDDDGLDLMTWAMDQLETTDSIAWIESEPSQGKTSFCQMWAAKVAQERYPNWMPVFIRLRHAVLGETLEHTLASAFPVGQFTCADGWLSSMHPPCLLILDGLDELPRSAQTERHISAFIAQILQFHERALTIPGGPRHKICLTSCAGILRDLTGQLPYPFQRIAIQPLAQAGFKQWFKQWANLQSKSIAQTYFSFLKQGGLFRKRFDDSALAGLVRQPMMLYLLGVLHRDGLLDEGIFRLDYPQVKFEIYDRISRWLLGECVRGLSTYQTAPALVREGLAHASRGPDAIANLLQGRRPQALYRQMQLAAQTILHSGCYQASQTEIQARFSDNTSNPKPQPVRLPVLYFRSQSVPEVDTTNPRFEFSHSSLGEYLAAEHIADQLKQLSKRVRGFYGEVTFAIPTADVAQHLYDLLGYGILSAEIEELAIERLRREQARDRTAFSFQVLFERLLQFYHAYCQGKWMDESIPHKTRPQLQALRNPLNVLQIDAAVGLNSFVLLCACQREGQLLFWPCGNPETTAEFNPDQLLAFIGRTAVLSPVAFWQRARHCLMALNLASARLKHVMLAGANLQQTNFVKAELNGANLASASLQGANFSEADLSDANLAEANLLNANLAGANLCGANLLGANLAMANLTNACLERSQLTERDRTIAKDSGAIFSLKQFLAYKQALAIQDVRNLQASNEPDIESTEFLLEDAEGKLIMADAAVFEEDADENYENTTTVMVERPE